MFEDPTCVLTTWPTLQDELAVTSSSVLHYVETVFIKKFINAIQKTVRLKETQK